MINYNGVELRNLEEQVRKNKEDIAAHYNMDRVLADFGIRILGRVDNYEELLKIPTDNLAYGDAYAVGEPNGSGVQTPFVFYIWTRPDPNAGKDEPYWFDMGELSIVGPQGPAGETGPKGDRGIRGSKWFSGSTVPSNPGNYETGDTYLRSNGDVYQIKENAENKLWVYATNIKGPVGATGQTGPRGPQGDKGDKGDKGNPGTTGALCNIIGEITSVDQLPAPTPATRYNGYLQEINGDQHLWVPVGPDNNLRWMDVGTIGGGGGSKIIKNGVVLDEYDVSNVVMKNDFSGEGFVFHEGDGIFVSEPLITKLAGDTEAHILSIPGRNLNGTMDVMTDAAVEEIVNTLDNDNIVEDTYPIRANEGCLRNNQATPRGYVDKLVKRKVNKAVDGMELYVNNRLGEKLDIPEKPTPAIMNYFPNLMPMYSFRDNAVDGVIPRIKCMALRRNSRIAIHSDYIFYARGAGLGGLTFNYVKDGEEKSINMTAAIMFPSSSGINGETNRWLFGMLYIDSTGQLQLWNDRIEQDPYIQNTAYSGGLAYVFSYGMYPPSNPFTDNTI